MPYYPSRSNQQPSGPPPKKRKLFSVVILSVSILLLVYGAVRLIGYGADWLSSRRTTQEIRKTAEETDSPVETVSPARAAAALSSPAPVPSGPPEAEENTAGLSDKLPPIEYSNGFEVNPRIQKLRKKYEYIIGWITMDDLDEPVAMKDNTFFLNHDAAGNRLENVRGELRLVTLALGGDITYREGAGADGESIGAATQENYRHVRRIAFYSDTGDTDLMLQYYLDITPTVDTSGYLRAAKKQTIPILTGNGIDLSAYPEGAAWEETLTRYCIALESGRAEKLTDVLSMEYLDLTADYIRRMTGSDTPTETILGEYREFYQQIMDDTLGSYASGGTVALSCEILGAEEASRSAIEATNAQLRSMLGNDAPVTEASVDLTVRFEVNGSEVTLSLPLVAMQRNCQLCIFSVTVNHRR